MNQIVNVIKFHEGFRANPYKCTAGIDTIGYGSTYNPFTGEEVTENTKPITEKEAEKWLSHQVSIDLKLILGELTKHEIFYLGTNRISALVNMKYNLGYSGLMNFKRMWNAIYADDYETASREALDSKWANQVGQRAKDIAHCLEHGEWPF